MTTDQFQWIDTNPEQESWAMCSVQLMGDKIDLAFENGPDVIGVVSDSELDNNRSWATVQIVGRALIYQASGKHPSWRLMKKNAGVGPRGPVDEYLIR
jgi:hypothetical protein